MGCGPSHIVAIVWQEVKSICQLARLFVIRWHIGEGVPPLKVAPGRSGPDSETREGKVYQAARAGRRFSTTSSTRSAAASYPK